MRYVGVFLLNVTNWITVTKFLTRANSINISKLGNLVFIATFMVDLIISHFLVQTLVDPLFLQLNVWGLHINSKSPITLCLLVAKVVSIGLFWFCFVSFLYNGVYFLQVFFNHTLSQYHGRTLIFKRWELRFASNTVGQRIDSRYILVFQDRSDSGP